MTSTHTTTHLICMHTTHISSHPYPLIPRPPTRRRHHSPPPPPKRKHSLIGIILKFIHFKPKPKPSSNHPSISHQNSQKHLQHHASNPTISPPLLQHHTTARLPILCSACLFTFNRHGITSQETRAQVLEFRMLFDMYGPLTPTPFWQSHRDGGVSNGKGEWILLFMCDDPRTVSGYEVDREKQKWWWELGFDCSSGKSEEGSSEKGRKRGRSKSRGRELDLDINRELPKMPTGDRGIEVGNAGCEIGRGVRKRADVDLNKCLPLLPSTRYEAPRRALRYADEEGT